jgi:hypothetical protein
MVSQRVFSLSLSLGEQDRYPSVGFPGAMNKSFSFDQDLRNDTFLVTEDTTNSLARRKIGDTASSEHHWYTLSLRHMHASSEL